MGTRSDFYIGIGKNAEWIGSVAYDGMPDAIAKYGILESSTEQGYRGLVSELDRRDDFTKPEEGWPWPWNDSLISSYAYAFHEGRVVFGSSFNTHSKWIDARGFLRDQNSPDPLSDNVAGIDGFEFPDMRERKKVALDARSGFMIAGVMK